MFNCHQRKHYPEQMSKTFTYRPHMHASKEILHGDEKPTGVRKIVAAGTIYKPKIERLQLTQGVKPEDLKEFVGPRDFLQRYQGVKQKIALKKLQEGREADREARTFHYAGIDIVTTQGKVTLTREMAKTLNAQQEGKTPHLGNGSKPDLQVNTKYEVRAEEEVSALDTWAAKHGLADDSD